MKVTILNAHSILNPGDVGIVLGQISFLRKHSPGIDISITSKTPEIDRPFYQSMGINVLGPLLPAPSNFPDRRISGVIKNLLNLKAKAEMIRTLRESTLVFLCGGGYFFSYRRFLLGPTFFQNLIHPILASVLRKPIIFFPQSIGPFSNHFTVLAINKLIGSESVNAVFLREKTSLNNFTKTVKEKDRSKLLLCPDMAFLMEESSSSEFNLKNNIELPRPVLGITLREWPFQGGSRTGEINRKTYLNSLVQTAKAFYSRFNGSILIVPQVWGPGSLEDDRPISREFYLRLKEIIPEKNLGLFEADEIPSPHYLVRLFSILDILIGTRFHSCIFAALSNIPFISISYQHKSSGIMEMLGLERFSIDISEVSEEKVIPLIEEILNSSEEMRRSLRGLIESIKIEAETTLMKTIGPFLRE